MTKRQNKAARAVINKDCRTTGTMLQECKHGCPNPATCAVGALAIASINGPLTLSQHKALIDCGGTGASLFRRFLKPIRRKFGLTSADLLEIMDSNDSVTGDAREWVFKRRRKVRDTLKRLAVEIHGLKV